MKNDSYRIFSASLNNLRSLEETMESMIRIGWEPCGGVCVVKKDSNTYFYQALWVPFRDHEKERPGR
jgi:hypothetical protein